MSEESPESRSAAEKDGDNARAAAAAERTDGADETDAVEEETAGENGPESPTAEEPESALVSRVAEFDETLAEDVAALEARLAAAEEDLEERDDRIEELESALKRSKADFKNYKKRAKKRQEEIRERATEDFVGRIVSVRDNLVRALDQDEDADIRPGVESTLEEFDRILEEENVEAIEPESGSDVDPTRHEVLMRVDDEEPEGTVADVYRPGYEMAGAVVREAQVTVSTGEGSDDEPSTDGDSEA
ncbi:nucleotide exchange factor GrpE [Halobellus clavatus]|jgi:molecular chaperone GrpE|uniref:Protein GrpE n=1 Tax=Halobellus clavatus TaxID=660517 RepID=A0A1H3F947_9EURY|nr:nucleotide exchange factor GrpE [Halobellus clavatus]SDX87367.1 molecular chaperone GrpE [Halobellus clavatus]